MTKRKLIEVALPLEAINKESAREKSIRHGHPSTLHLWWARRPLAACRAVLFASLVDDPSSHPDTFPTDEDQQRERDRLFNLIEQLVKWENTNNEDVLRAAREEILKSTDGNPPPVLDPFCGGGSIPLEAQRLGLEAHGSDLNPVAVLITKALIEIPPRFAGLPPVGGRGQGTGNREEGTGNRGQGAWNQSALRNAVPSNLSPSPSSPHVTSRAGSAGLAADVRHYGQWMRDEAERRIGHLYPKVRLPKEQGGGEATVIAWLWARTVTCPNPACGAQMPLVRSFELSKKRGKRAWVEPKIDQARRTVEFEVKTGSGPVPDPPKIGRGAKFKCLVCGDVAEDQHIKDEALAGRMSEQLLAIVADGPSGRAYVSPNAEHEHMATDAGRPDVRLGPLADDPRNIWCVGYGLTQIGDLFTDRQLVALTTFSDLVGEARERALADAIAAGLPDDGVRLADGGAGAPAYADAIATYLAFAVDRLVESSCSLARWQSTGDFVAGAFSRQALPMLWDFAEVNPFSASTRNFLDAVEWVAETIDKLPASVPGFAIQQDAMAAVGGGAHHYLIATDPPYYDNIGYADLSDFFYVWLRRMLGSVYPGTLGTLLTPKSTELIASPYRFDGRRTEAEQFFEDGLRRTFMNARSAQNPDFPVLVFYAFKQAETDMRGSNGTASTGWEKMLDGLLRSGYMIQGTWPMRTERTGRTLSLGTNALASSVVLACRPRDENAPLALSTDFLRELRQELPDALRHLQRGNIAPVDLAQAAIGPGMAVFSRYSKVLETDGSPMRVRRALELINQVLDEVLAEQEGEFDPDTRWAITWFEQHGNRPAEYGSAETLSKAKNNSVTGLEQAGIVESGRGKVRLLKRDELAPDWNPATDRRTPIWEITHRLIHARETEGETGAAELLSRLSGDAGEVARDLAYRLFQTCERKGWTDEAREYNALVISWPEIQRLAGEARQVGF